MNIKRKLAVSFVAVTVLLGGSMSVAEAKPKSPDGSSEWSEAKCDRVQRGLDNLADHIRTVEEGEWPYDGNNDALLVKLYALFNEIQRLHFMKCSDYVVVGGLEVGVANPGTGTVSEPRSPAGVPTAPRSPASPVLSLG